jgi:quinol-cytochrome oxidoreductase complex cytochrome b subunit
MNVAVPLLGIILVIGAVLGLYAVAAQNAAPVQGTYGDMPSAAANTSREVVMNQTAPAVLNFGGGMFFLLAAIFLIVAAVAAWKAINTGGYSGRRG